MQIGETASNGNTAIYGVDNYSRGVAYSREVAQLWASAPDLVAALQYVLLLCGTEREDEFPHLLKVDIPETCRAALERTSAGLGDSVDTKTGSLPT